MSYTIDFHFGDVLMGHEQAHKQVYVVCCRAGLSFLSYCDELYIDENGEADTKFPSVKVTSIEKATAIAQNWIGRAHYYRWQTLLDLGVYAWKDRVNCVVLCADYRDWMNVMKDKALVVKIGGIICSVSEAIGSPFGFFHVNSNYIPLNKLAFIETMALIRSGSPEPQLMWVAESYLPYAELLTAAGNNRTIIRSLSGYSLALSEEESD